MGLICTEEIVKRITKTTILHILSKENICVAEWKYTTQLF